MCLDYETKTQNSDFFSHTIPSLNLTVLSIHVITKVSSKVTLLCDNKSDLI